MATNRWTEERIALLQELYPVQTNIHTGEALGMSERSVREKARELGLEKAVKAKWLEQAEYVRNHYLDRSFAELAKDLNISKTSVSRMASKLGLKRTVKEQHTISSRIRCELIKRERGRIVFGLEPLTNLKVTTNRKRIYLKAKLKAKGYMANTGSHTIYYKDSIRRSMKQETHGSKLGLRFLPFPVGELTQFSTSI